MLAFVRAGYRRRARRCCCPFPAIAAADKPFQRDDLADAAIKLEAQIKSRSRPGHQDRRGAAARGRRRLPAQRLPHRHAAARADRRRSRPTTARTGCGSPRPSCRSVRATTASAPLLLERAATAAYIAYQRTEQSERGGRQPASSSAAALPTAALAAGARCAARCRSTCARSPTCASTTSACARTTASACSTTRSMPMRPRRAPASSSPRSCRASAPTSRRSSRSPARTSPRSPPRTSSSASKGSSTASATASRCAPACPRLVKETLAKSADFNIYVRDRKPFVRFAGKAYVLPRTGQRGIPVVSVNTTAVDDRDLPHRRPQPARHRAGPRLPAQPRPLRPRPADRRARRQGLEGRDDGRADAQRRRHHRLSGRSGDRRPGSPASMSMAAQPARGAPSDDLRLARDPVVHRLRSRPDRVLRQRRHPRVRAIRWIPPQPKGAGRGAAAVAQQRSARDQTHRRRRPRAVRGRPDARRGRAGAGHAGRDRRQGRLRLPQPARRRRST